MVNDEYSQDAYDDGWPREGDDGCSGDSYECDDGLSREEHDEYSDNGYDEDAHHYGYEEDTHH